MIALCLGERIAGACNYCEPGDYLHGRGVEVRLGNTGVSLCKAVISLTSLSLLSPNYHHKHRCGGVNHNGQREIGIANHKRWISCG